MVSCWRPLMCWCWWCCCVSLTMMLISTALMDSEGVQPLSQEHDLNSILKQMPPSSFTAAAGGSAGGRQHQHSRGVCVGGGGAQVQPTRLAQEDGPSCSAADRMSALCLLHLDRHNTLSSCTALVHQLTVGVEYGCCEAHFGWIKREGVPAQHDRHGMKASAWLSHVQAACIKQGVV